VPEPLKSPDASGIADSGGVGIAWWSAGAGDRTLLIVPTWNFVDSRVTADLANDLRDEFRVVWFDARGSGSSGRPAAGYTMFDHAHDVAAVVEAAGIDRMTMAAGSMGCNAMLLAAARLADRVDGLVFLGLSVDPDAALPDAAEMEAFRGPPPPVPEGFGWFNAEIFRRDWAGFRRWFFDACFNEPDSQATRDSVSAIAADADVEVLIQQELDMAARPHGQAVLEAIASLTVPALLIHGDADLVAPVEAARRVADLLPAGHLVLVEGGGHRPDVRHPELINPLIRAFAANRPLPGVPTQQRS
jgi:pimeloyl-ACP methyl ester carboxylesterase